MRVWFPSRSCSDKNDAHHRQQTSANLVDLLTRRTKRLYRECSDRTWCVALFLFSFALLWRALYLHQTAAGSPFFDAPMADAQAFFQQAEQFAATFSLGEEPFTGPPLYPVFLGVLFRLFGADFFAFRLIQFTLGALSVVLLYLIGRRVFSPGVGLAAGAAAAVYGPLIYFEGELLPPGLAILLGLSLVLFLLRRGYRQAPLVLPCCRTPSGRGRPRRFPSVPLRPGGWPDGYSCAGIRGCLPASAASCCWRWGCFSSSAAPRGETTTRVGTWSCSHRTRA